MFKYFIINYNLIHTGSGKSAIFQLSTLVSHGFTIVISPLVSLVEDQVGHLTGRGISAINLTCCALENAVETQLLMDFKAGNVSSKFLYLTPEKLSHCKSLLDALKNSVSCQHYPLNLVVIDEAHCYSEWGKNLSYYEYNLHNQMNEKVFRT